MMHKSMFQYSWLLKVQLPFEEHLNKVTINIIQQNPKSL
uniref:Uncharacterized protein n=1 Tax=Arundo donax TaxID=35708 RepID=A0A0A9G275_ARUDO